MAAVTPKTGSTPALARQDLANDLRSLLALPSTSRTSLFRLSTSTSAAPSSPQPTPNTTDTLRTVIDRLDTFSPSSKNHEASLSLSRAYVKTMRTEVLKMDDGRLDRLGQRVDEVREKGTEIVEALGEVKP